MAARTNTKQTHQGRNMFPQQRNGSGRWSQKYWQRKERRGANKGRTTSITSVMSRELMVDWNIKRKKGGGNELRLVGEDEGGERGWKAENEDNCVIWERMAGLVPRVMLSDRRDLRIRTEISSSWQSSSASAPLGEC